MTEKKITETDLQKLIAEEVNKLVAENRDEIVKRAWKRLQEMKGKTTDGASLSELP